MLDATIDNSCIFFMLIFNLLNKLCIFSVERVIFNRTKFNNFFSIYEPTPVIHQDLLCILLFILMFSYFIEEHEFSWNVNYLSTSKQPQIKTVPPVIFVSVDYDLNQTFP